MMNEKQIEAELRLFKGYTISEDEFYDGKLRENAYGNGILFLENMLWTYSGSSRHGAVVNESD